MKMDDITVKLKIDTSEFDAAAEQVRAKLTELTKLAESIKAAQPGLSAEVDAVIDGIERMARIEVQPKDPGENE